MCPISASSASGRWGTASDLLQEMELRRPTAKMQFPCSHSHHGECCLNRISSISFILLPALASALTFTLAMAGLPPHILPTVL